MALHSLVKSRLLFLFLIIFLTFQPCFSNAASNQIVGSPKQLGVDKRQDNLFHTFAPFEPHDSPIENVDYPYTRRKSTHVNIADSRRIFEDPADSVATFRPSRARSSPPVGHYTDKPAHTNKNDRVLYSAASKAGEGDIDSVNTSLYSSSSQPRTRPRSIQDWSMENLVLMATVDGAIYARRRDTGEEVWSFMSDRPMIEIEYPSSNITQPKLHDNSSDSKWVDDTDDLTLNRPSFCSQDDFMWIVEPSQDGALYVMAPGPTGGLQSLGITVRQLAEELSPYSSENSPFIYTAEKKNTLYALSALDGAPLSFYSASGGGSSYVPIARNKCRNVTPLETLEDDSAECERIPTLMLGRTHYTIAVHDRRSGRLVCTIKYMEWTPNNRDRDLQAQYLAPMDHRYIYSRYDGGIIALQYRDTQSFDSLAPYDRSNQDAPPKLYSQVRLLYNTKFTHSPVVQVFDIARPVSNEDGDNTHIVLSQPIAPNSHQNPKRGDTVDFNAIFVNRTQEGSWYALSDSRFPSVTDGASKAECYLPDGSFVLPPLNVLRSVDASQQCKHLVGVHFLSSSAPFGKFPGQLTIDPPKQVGIPLDNSGANTARDHGRSPDPPFFHPPARFPLLSLGFVFSLSLFSLAFFVMALKTPGKSFRFLSSSFSQPHGSGVELVKSDSVISQHEPVNQPLEEILFREEEDKQELVKTVRFVNLPLKSESSSTLSQSDPAELIIQPSGSNADNASPKEKDSNLESGSEMKKKKAHRGARGGRRRKKKSAVAEIPTPDSEEISEATDGRAVSTAISSASISELSVENDDTHTISNLVISKSSVLGHGSGGTVVFEGRFEGRRVAVKRLLLESFQLASQEVDLLQQSDDHPNVIRYFCHQKDSDFLYIALELCQASIWDLFQGAGGTMSQSGDVESLLTLLKTNVVSSLYQLASGLAHLHSLRIVHRDIKPQNILIAYPKKNTNPFSLRLVISDFGLCRSLPEDASTLVGTAGNAGTIGWKAPELILQPRSGEGRSSASGSYSQGSPEEFVGADTPSMGVKRSVDIFSLGCVFFYVLTNGAHPFDNADNETWHSLREVNIKKNKKNFDRLRELEGDSAEPLHLIEWMLNPNPESRPIATQVMNHPFFWSPAKRLSFLCDVSDYWERECRDPPSPHLLELEKNALLVLSGADSCSPELFSSTPFSTPLHSAVFSKQATPHSALANPQTAVVNFMDKFHKSFVDTLGKQRKYCGDKMVDLLRALRNKRNHYTEMPEEVKAKVGPLPDGYLNYWSSRFPLLLMTCWKTVNECGLADQSPFRQYIWGDESSLR